jgi:hypothetical protein
MWSQSKIKASRAAQAAARKTIRYGAVLVFGTFAWAGAGEALADVDYRDTLEKAVTPNNNLMPPEDFFDVFVAAAEAYDSNLYRLDSNVDAAAAVRPGASREDYINTDSAGLDGQWTVGKQLLNLDLRADYNRFSRNDDLNNVSSVDSLAWNWSVGPSLSGQVGADYNRSLAGFYNTNVYSRDMVDRGEYFTSLRYQVGPHLTLTGGILFQDTTLSAAAAQANDNHRKIVDLGAEYALNVSTSIGVDYRYTDTRYSQNSVLNGVEFSPDYREDSPRVVFKYAPTEKTQLTAIAGYLKRDYPSNAIANYDGEIWQVAWQWNPTAKTQLLVTTWRNLQADFTAETDYFVSNAVTVSPSWTPTEKLTFSLSGSYEKQKYIGADLFVIDLTQRRDSITTEEIDLVYTPFVHTVAKSLTFNFSYRHQHRDSNQVDSSYDDEIAKAGAAFKF